MKPYGESTGYAETDHRRAVGDLCEHVLTEVLGATAARACNGPPSLFTELEALYGRCDPARDDFTPLRPGPVVDRCLSRLVAIVRGHYVPGAGRVADERLQLDTARTVIERIHAQPELGRRAGLIRRIACIAETEMERHYSERLLQALQTRSASEFSHEPPEQRLQQALFGFPYVQSYRQLVAAEIDLLRQPVSPLFIRDRLRAQVHPTLCEALDRLRRSLSVHLPRRGLSYPLAIGELDKQVVAVCGCGPLPISGLMLHVATGARVVLIDLDRKAVTQARALVQELERLQVLTPGAVSVRGGDAGRLRYQSGCGTERGNAVVYCNAVIVASLIPYEAKLRIARSLCRPRGAAPAALLMRSATSLTAQLAYEPVDTHRISSLNLPFCGEALPRNHVYTSLDPETAAARGVIGPATRDLLQVTHPNVLNSSELYHRLPLQLAKRAADFSGCPDEPRLRLDIEYAIHRLQNG